MTQATQAQIEAAAEAMHRYDVEHGFNADGLAAIENYLPMAAAALTAAAEVEEPHKAKEIPASIKLYRLFKAVWQDAEKEIQEIEAATIERCAQVVMDYLIKFQKEVDEDDQIAGRGVAIVLAELAAAIRALKDKP